MKTNHKLRIGCWAAPVAILCLFGCLAAVPATAAAGHTVDGLTGTYFNFTAKPGFISTADGNSVYFWGYANGNGPAQYPGPTLLLVQGQSVNITLNNQLPVPVSLLFPGQNGDPVITGGGQQGALTREVLPGGSDSLTYSFIATEPGTYTFYSGTQPDLQVEMGLVGTIIVYPTNSAGVKIANQAYSHTSTTFAQEFLFFLSDMDESIHIAVEQKVMASQPIVVDMTKRRPVYWFINGRTGPDTMLGPGADSPWLPAQPYDCMPIFYVGDEVLMRVVGGGRDPHPFHHHGNHARTVARDGRLLASTPASGPDLQQLHFTIPSTPGGTVDAIFSWTGAGIGWDVYGHLPGDPAAPGELTGPGSDHGKPFPVNLPPDQNLSFGQMYGGSPFLGTPANLPPGMGGFNAGNGFMYMWHSHNEKEIVNNNVFPGGLMTMALILPRP